MKIDFNIQVGEKVSKTLQFSKEEIINFATLVGDQNPLHHDENFAKTTKFGGLIMSGTQPMSILTGMAASLISEKGPSVGTNGTLQFLKPLYPEEKISFEVEITQIEWNKKLQGNVIFFMGKAIKENGDLAVYLTGKGLLKKDL